MPVSQSAVMPWHGWRCDRQHGLPKWCGPAHEACADGIFNQRGNEPAACKEETQPEYLVFKVGRREALGRLSGVDAAHTAANAKLQVEHEVIAAVTLVDGLTWPGGIALALLIHQQRGQPHHEILEYNQSTSEAHAEALRDLMVSQAGLQGPYTCASWAS